ncbi:hypothetical protein [uncultured Pseudoteredinibacter sp.]|uniref:hypothetical protein n=1 Tax=uncultured Pseudoteredinibacter sp. TaxID=1641701 RepID=UPI0026027220|nr:hypothetical protein [uncultured Pseudoteredinibacter sp.]
MLREKAIDIEGNELKLGDWVTVVIAPISILGMPNESLIVFSSAIGRNYQVMDIDNYGAVELHVRRFDTIYIEPFCLRRFRRYKKFSKPFQKQLAILESIRKND